MEQIEAIKPRQIELGAEHQVVVLPEGWCVEDISKYLPPPDRIRQRIELLTLEAFLDYVSTFSIPASVVFADETAAQYEAVIDYHDDPASGAEDERGTCDHVARYVCPKADQWTLWMQSSGKHMTQVDFAQFIENNLPDIIAPLAADFLQLVLQLQIHKSANFVSDTRLDNGQTRLRYEETIRNDTKQGDLQFPAAFTINIPVFVDGTCYQLKSRLRYRLEESKLKLWYELERPVDTFRAAVKEVTASIRKGLPEVAVYAGKRG